MLALVWDGTTASVKEHPDPRPASDRAIVRVERAGICNTDLEIVRGYMAFRGVLGHEVAGVVVDGPAEWLGRRVVSEINFGCGRCPMCARGLRRHCPHRTVMGILGADGALAEMVSVPIDNLHAVPDDVSDDQAVFAEPLAAAFEILEQVHVEPASSVLVLGDGKLGLLVAHVLHGTGADVTLVGRHEHKLAVASRMGVRTVVDSCLTVAPTFDLVVEATGTAAGFALALSCTRPRGTLVLKSTVADAVTVDMAPLVIHEISVVGSRCGSFPPALRALTTPSDQEGGPGKQSHPPLDVTPLISRRFALADAKEALRAAAERSVLKVLVQPE